MTVSVRILGLIRLSAKQSLSVASRYTETDSGERYKRAHHPKTDCPSIAHIVIAHTVRSGMLPGRLLWPERWWLVAREQCKSHAAVAALTEIHHIGLRFGAVAAVAGGADAVVVVPGASFDARPSDDC